MNKPPCSDWSVWKGPEIEGTKGVGVATLFIRSLASFKIESGKDWQWIRTKSNCPRVWFCKEFFTKSIKGPNGEFLAWDFIRAIGKHFDEVCLEVEPQHLPGVPRDIKKMARLYLKINVEQLKSGDFVCVGPTFSDEAFEIGTGARVKPEEYLNDKKIV
jgi:hypothetical protein